MPSMVLCVRETEKDIYHGQTTLNCDTHSSVFLKFVQPLACPERTLGTKVPKDPEAQPIGSFSGHPSPVLDSDSSAARTIRQCLLAIPYLPSRNETLVTCSQPALLIFVQLVV